MEEDIQRSIFQAASGDTLSQEQLIEEIRKFLNKSPKSPYTLVIGTDSHEKDPSKEPNAINVVTAVVVYRQGFGGRYFWKRKTVKNIHTLRDKIYAETLESLNFAKEFVPLLEELLSENTFTYKLEIHVDVGEFGDTREMIREVVGMVTGMGFIAKTKPESFGASYVADRHT